MNDTENPQEPALPVGKQSLIQWHLGALLLWLGAFGLGVGLGDAKSFAHSKEPVESVFSVVWDFFFVLVPAAVFLLIARWGVRLQRRHWQWQLPEFNRLAAVTLLSLVSLPMLGLSGLIAAAAINDWLKAFQSGATQVPGLLALAGGLVGGSPWLYSQIKAWRSYLSR